MLSTRNQSTQKPAWFSWGAVQRWRQCLPLLHLQRKPRLLRLCESVSLGEKRLVAVIEYDREKFLIGGSTQSVHLLARLGNNPDFSELLSEWCERQQ